MNGFCCQKCGWIFPLSDAGEEYVNLKHGGPATRYSCPECLSIKLTEMHVCPECQREELADGEDLGKKCLQYEQDKLDELAEIDEWRVAL